MSLVWALAPAVAGVDGDVAALDGSMLAITTGRCSKGVELLLSSQVGGAEKPQRERVAAWGSRVSTVPTGKVRIVCDMARHGKGSNGIGAGRARIRDARVSSSRSTLANRLRSSDRSWIGLCLPAAGVLPRGCCT